MGGGVGMMREDPPRRCKGETGNGRESGCRNRKRPRNNIDTTVDAVSDQPLTDGDQEAETGGVGRWRVIITLQYYRGAVEMV